LSSFMLYPRNFRQPIVNISVQGEPLIDLQSWRWISGIDLIENTTWTIEWESEDGKKQAWDLDWTQHFDKLTTSGYRGGYVVSSGLQN